MVEKAPQEKYTNAEIINLVTTRINVQSEVRDNTRMQADKVVAIHARTEVAKMLAVFAENGSSLQQSINLHKSEDNFFNTWYAVDWFPKTNSLIRTMQNIGEEKTIVSENADNDWAEYGPKIPERCSELAKNK
jgi:hypothetical protein